jgi:hypothetical protein
MIKDTTSTPPKSQWTHPVDDIQRPPSNPTRIYDTATSQDYGYPTENSPTYGASFRDGGSSSASVRSGPSRQGSARPAAPASRAGSSLRSTSSSPFLSSTQPLAGESPRPYAFSSSPSSLSGGIPQIQPPSNMSPTLLHSTYAIAPQESYDPQDFFFDPSSSLFFPPDRVNSPGTRCEPIRSSTSVMLLSPFFSLSSSSCARSKTL